MGLFSLPADLEDPSAEQLVDAAIANLNLWKAHQHADYLIYPFAAKFLDDAMRKIRPDDTV